MEGEPRSGVLSSWSERELPRPPERSVEKKLKIVLSVLSREMSVAEGSRAHGISATPIGNWGNSRSG